MQCYIFDIRAWFQDPKVLNILKKPYVHKYGGLCNTDPSHNLTVVTIIPVFMIVIIIVSRGMVL